MQWHIDAPNSALHMAVSVHGGRTLKMKLRDPFALDTKTGTLAMGWFSPRLTPVYPFPCCGPAKPCVGCLLVQGAS